jgi:hypothetical protein
VAGCVGAPRVGSPDAGGGPVVDRVDGLRAAPLRVVPPAPGECVGAVEVTVFNDGPETAHVGRLYVLQDGKASDNAGAGPQFGPDGPEFETFDAFDESYELAPGASCVLRKPMVRAHAGAPRVVAVRGQAVAFPSPDARRELTTPPVEVDPSAWPVPEPMTPAALDRALAAGSGLRVVFYDIAMPLGGMCSLDVSPDGAAHGAGLGRFAGRADFEDFCAAGALTQAQQDALRVAVRAASFAAYRPDPRWRHVADGRGVRLLVAAGPAAFAACSQWPDFHAAGLTPLCETLRAAACDLADRVAER